MQSVTVDIHAAWSRIERVLKQYVPETARTLAPPATDRDIADLEAAIGLELRDDFRQSLQVHNGQDDPSRCRSFTYDGILASTVQVAETWRMLTALDERLRQEEPTWDALDHGDWWNRHWVPITFADSDCLCINLNPQVRAGGTFGEIVCHIHDNPHEPGIARSYGDWLGGIAQKLDAGEFTINEYGRLELNIR